MASTERDTDSPVVRRGRPTGEVSPESLIRLELIAHLRLYKKTREIIESRLELGTADADELTKYMDLLRKGIVEMAKPFIAAAKPDSSRSNEPEEDGEAILRKMIEGQESRR